VDSPAEGCHGATDALETAFKQRNDTVTGLGPIQTSVVLLVDDLNRELVRLEGGSA